MLSLPRALLQDVSQILDDEAEMFVMKLWRLVIYETEAKLAGVA
jgi:RNA-binding protein 25